MKRTVLFVLLACITFLPVWAQEHKPDLWLLAIGINRYYNVPRTQHLRFAKQNLKAIIDSVKPQEGRVFNNIHIFQVLDDTEITPTGKNISNSLTFLKQARQDDVIMLYYSGHGDIDKSTGKYYLLPSDLAFHVDGTIDFSTAISMDEIKSCLSDSAVHIVFIESCYSASAIKELKDSNTIIFASSLEDEDSIEMPLLLRGAYNLAVSDGMSGKAAVNGVITLGFLGEYAYDRVVQMTHDKQHPAAYILDGYRDFVIALVE
jgi:uncharacterized caspase-like protein